MSKYLILILPPQDIINYVDQFRDKYAKYTSYIIPPHITIYPPFFLNEGVSEENIVKVIKDQVNSIQPGEIIIDSIGSFEQGNNVLFFKPDKKSEKGLKDLFEKIVNGVKPMVKDVYKNYNFKIDDYKPHITIAEKIPDKEFVKIKNELNKLDVNFYFEIEYVYLFRQEENSRQWFGRSDC